MDICKRCGYEGLSIDTTNKLCPKCGLYHWWGPYPKVPDYVHVREYNMVREANMLKVEEWKRRSKHDRPIRQ